MRNSEADLGSVCLFKWLEILSLYEKRCKILEGNDWTF